MGNLVVAYTELGLPVVSSYFNELGHLAYVAGVGKGDGGIWAHEGEGSLPFSLACPNSPFPLPFNACHAGYSSPYSRLFIPREDDVFPLGIIK